MSRFLSLRSGDRDIRINFDHVITYESTPNDGTNLEFADERWLRVVQSVRQIDEWLAARDPQIQATPIAAWPGGRTTYSDVVRLASEKQRVEVALAEATANATIANTEAVRLGIGPEEETPDV